MANRDLKSDIKATSGFNNKNITSDGTYNGLHNDLSSVGSVTIFVNSTAYTDGTYTPRITHSDIQYGSYTAVDSEFLIGSEDEAAIDGANQMKRIGYVGKKRYLKVDIEASGVTTGASVGVSVVYGSLANNPAGADLNTRLEAIPTDIEGNIMWIDFADDTTVTLDNNGNISAVSDKSTAGNANVTSANPLANPSYIEDSLGGKNVARFNGTEDFLLFNGNDFIGTDYTVIAVDKLGGTSVSPQCIIGGTNPTGPSTNLHIAYRSSGNEVTNAIRGSSAVLTNYKDFEIGKPRIHAATSSSTNGKSYQVFEDYSNIKVVDSTAVEQLVSYDGASIGRIVNTAPDLLYNGDIAEIIAYNRALNDEEIAQIARYLSKKYQLPTYELDFPFASFNMLFRYDANSQSSVLDQSSNSVLNGFIDTWGDTAGNGNNVSNPNQPEEAPTLKLGGIAGKNSVYFSGQLPYFQRVGLTELGGNPSMTVFIVALDESATPTDQRMMQLGSNAASGGSIIAFAPDSSFRYNGGSLKRYANDPMNDSPATLGTWVRTAGTDTSGGKFFKNGVEATSTDTLSPIVPSFGTDEVLVGAERPTGGQPLNDFEGQIGEIIVYDQELSNSERESIENFLMNKWQII